MRGFYITYDRNYSWVGVRGFGRLGDYNIRVLVLVDGHRINDNIFGEAYLGSGFLVDVDLIERVEIIRGPALRSTAPTPSLRSSMSLPANLLN